MALTKAQKALRKLACSKKASDLQWFFKTGPGEYGEGDVFLGVAVPDTRKVARQHRDAADGELSSLLNSKYHEDRFLALLILTARFERGDEQIKKNVYQTYLQRTDAVNNWDLVDVSAHKIVGAYLIDKSRKPLFKLARSKTLWERRIAVISTFRFIADNDFDDALAIADLLLDDSHDLIQKAVGWMIREIGNRDQSSMEKFLKTRYRKMPRTMLRYAIEKLPEKRRQAYLKGRI